MAKSPVRTNETSTPDKTTLVRKPKFTDYLRVFTYATKWDFFVYVVASVASIAAGVTLPLMNIIFGQLVGQFTSYFSDTSTISRSQFESILNRQALYITALFVGRWALNAINKFCFRMIGIRLSSAIRLHYLQSLFAQSIHVIDSMPPGAAATAITGTSAVLQIGISDRLGTFLQFNGTIWAALVIAFIWSWDLTLVTSSLILYILIVLAVVMPIIVKGETATTDADAQGTAIASEALGGIRLVMACGAQSHIISRYECWVQEAMKRAQKTAPVVGIQFGLIFFGVFGAFGLAFWYGTQRYIAGSLNNAGVVVVVLMSVMMILTSLERISTPIIAVSKAMVAACELFTVIDAPLPPTGTLKPEIDSHDIVFEDVTFEYPSRAGVKVLNSLSFCIQPGQNIALVGPSGSGKSTIVGLLERWYSLREQHTLPRVVEDQSSEKPENETVECVNEELKSLILPNLSGTITVGGVNLEDLDLKWWRAQVGLVQQEPFLFNNTIFSNVANGLIGTEWENEPETVKRELVRDACQESYAHEFICRLPDGYDTRVGDGGAKLSGGQKQRLAIARTLNLSTPGKSLGLVAMFITMPIMLGAGLWKYRHEVQFDKMNMAVFGESSQFATEAIGAIRTVSSLGMESVINARYEKLLSGHILAARRKAQWTAVLYGFADSVSLGCQALVFWYGGRLLASGEYSMEAFFVCFMAIIQGAEAASQILAVAPSAAQAAAAADRILDVRESADVGQTATRGSEDIAEAEGGVRVELRDVHFKYPTRDVVVFEGLNLTIEKGQYAAFVGPSGCGKTTIISLLERFYDLKKGHGSILCNGVNIHDLDVYDYRQNISLVAQEPIMFRGTVRDNILFGIEDPNSIADERIHEVCIDAFIHDFIVSLPEGYDTDVGAKGVSMSGGQKQRIAIARALIRDPKLLLLDEATSALDSESEKIVQAAFERARDGRTVVAVAHRLSTIQNADVIFVFSEGRVVEKGSHNELIRKQGVYWEMCQSQALDQ
ncbi:ABC transporter [Colletotrichum tofieldiae]|nr:ABC transporter [Colletotrichum tofieldiae]